MIYCGYEKDKDKKDMDNIVNNYHVISYIGFKLSFYR